jgi:hypothetical protein
MFSLLFDVKKNQNALNALCALHTALPIVPVRNAGRAHRTRV